MENLVLYLERDGENLGLFFPQPSVERVEPCIDFFGFLFDDFKKYSNILRFSKDFQSVVKKVSKQENIPNLGALLEAFFIECFSAMKPINKGIEAEGLELYNAFSDDEKAILKAQLAFIYALIRYLPTKIKEKELSAYCTASTLEECRGHFMRFIEAMDAESLSLENQVG